MKTFNDLQAVGRDETARMRFIVAAIDEHKQAERYAIARAGEAYAARRNTTINQYRRVLYDLNGIAHTDPFRANHTIASGFFQRFVNQQVQYLLGNGLTLTDPTHKAGLGVDFDAQLQKLGHDALVGGVAFGFWDFDRLRTFKLTEFVPLYDEENGALCAGIRFWQVARTKPLRATLYELDGVTDYISDGDSGELTTLREKRPYRLTIAHSELYGDEIYDGENYPTFPIIPLWGNQHHQSELVGIREAIDCYDLIKSGFANDIDEAAQIYWILKNTGGMDDLDLARFLDRIHTVGAATVDADAGADAEAHTLEVPYEGRLAYLDRLERDLYKDYQALDVSTLTGGEKTATEIRAAYEPMNEKANLFEHQVDQFLQDLFKLVGIDDTWTFKRSMLVNELEATQMILMAAPYIGDDMVLAHIPWVSPEEVETIKGARDAEDFDRFTEGVNDEPTG